MVGCGYGAQVLVPALRADPRVEIVAITAGRPERAREAARALGIGCAPEDWRTMLAQDGLDAVAIAAPPALQSEIALAAFGRGLHVFAEKPLALDLESARRLTRVALGSGRAHAIDFNFRAVDALRATREIVRAKTLGDLRHVTAVWQVESYANKVRAESWKTDDQAGGGALSNFVSHTLDYLEWLVGPITGLSARLGFLPGDARPNDTFVSLTFSLDCGASGSLIMSAAAYRGSGHRVEIYGAAGALVLDNPGPDHMRGFRLSLARRPDDFERIATPADAADIWEDGRVLPSSRLARGFLDWIQRGAPAAPDFTTGLRVQELMDAARRSHASGQWVDTKPREATA